MYLIAVASKIPDAAWLTGLETYAGYMPMLLHGNKEKFWFDMNK